MELRRIDELSIEIIDGDRGVNYPSKEQLLKTGHCVFLNTSNVTSYGLKFERLEYITEECDKLLRNGRLNRNDVVMTTRGTLGNIGLYGLDVPYEHVRINSGMVIFRCNTNEILPEYLFTTMQSYIVKKQIELFSSGSVQKQLPISVIKQIKIPIIPIDEQTNMVKNLNTVTTKISNNIKLIAYLEEYAQLLFHKWFIDFNFPNENGEPYKDSGGEMVEVEGKTIPKYWKIVMLSDLVTFKNGINYSADNNEIPNSKIISVKHLTRNTILNEKMADDIYLNTCISEEYKIKKFDTIIARSASPGESAIALRDLDVYYSGFSIRVRPKEEAWKYITYFNSLLLKKIITSHSDGTIIKNITQQSLSNFKVLKPADNIVELFNQQIELILLKIESLKNETETLIEMRDLLINKLIK